MSKMSDVLMPVPLKIRNDIMTYVWNIPVPAGMARVWVMRTREWSLNIVMRFMIRIRGNRDFPIRLCGELSGISLVLIVAELGHVC